MSRPVPLNAWPESAKPPAGAVLNPRHPLAASVLACWLFNEGGGGKAADCGPHGFHAVANAASPSTACNMKFAALDGVNGLMTRVGSSGATGSGRFQTRASPLLTPTRFSVELRLRFTAHAAASSSFWWGTSGATASNRGVAFEFTSSLSPTTNPRFIVGTTSLTTSVNFMKPLHLVGTCVLGGGSGDFKYYVDGVLVGTTSPPATSPFGRSDVAIGARPVSSEGCHEAYNDFLILYNRVLTAEEVWDRYKRPYAIAALPRAVPRFGVASSPPPPPPAYSGAVLFPCCM